MDNELFYHKLKDDLQSTAGKKMAAVRFTKIPCKPNTGHKAQRKSIFLQYLYLYLRQ